MPKSETAYSTSDNEYGDLNSTDDENQSDCCSSSSDGDEEEIWNGVPLEMISRDIENAPPLPEAQGRQTALQNVNSLIFWFVYFLLIWQATCHLSDNGLAWLLNFLVSRLRVLGVEISNEVFEKLAITFPGSLYLVRQFLNVDRDDLNKLVVCQKRTKLYKYDSLLAMINNRQVAKKCSNTLLQKKKTNL